MSVALRRIQQIVTRRQRHPSPARRLGKSTQMSFHPIGHMIPGVAGQNPLAPAASLCTSFFAIFPGLAQELCQSVRVGLQEPRLAGAFHLPHLGSRQILARSRYEPGVVGAAELLGRAAVGHDHGETASHGLGDGHTEALAPVRMHQAVAGGVEPRHLGIGERLVDHHQLGIARIAPEALEEVAGGLALVEALAAHVLDDHGDLVAGAEGAGIGREQDVDPLAIDRPPHEEEAELPRHRDFKGRGTGPEALGIHPVGNHRHALLRKPRGHVAVLDKLRRHPELVEVALPGLDPGLGNRAKLPGLDGDPASFAGRHQHRRPLVAHVHFRRGLQRGVHQLSQGLQAVPRLWTEFVGLVGDE